MKTFSSTKFVQSFRVITDLVRFYTLPGQESNKKDLVGLISIEKEVAFIFSSHGRKNFHIKLRF